MTLLDIARTGEATLAVAAIFVAARSPRHRLLAAWLALSLTHAIASHAWVAPWLQSSPQPYVGAARLVFHLDQAMYVLLPFAFVGVAWALIRVPRWLRPLPWASAFILMVILVDGYGHGPSPGLNQVARLTFRSETIFRLASIAGDAMLLLVLIPRWHEVVEECVDTDDTALLGTIVALEVAAVVVLALSFTPLHRLENFVASTMIVAYAVALGFHAPLVVLHVQGVRSERFVVRQQRALRREAIYEMEWRLEESRDAIGRMYDKGGPTPRSLPQAFPVAVRRRCSKDLLTLATNEPVVAGGVELVMAIAKCLGPKYGALLVADAKSLVGSLAPDDGGRNGEFDWVEALEQVTSSIDKGFYIPLLLPLFGTLRGMSWNEAIRTLDFAERLVGPATTM